LSSIKLIGGLAVQLTFLDFSRLGYGSEKKKDRGYFINHAAGIHSGNPAVACQKGLSAISGQQYKPKRCIKRCILSLSFPQSSGGNPEYKRSGCPTENFGHDGRHGCQ
jgi:hypothetical protein